MVDATGANLTMEGFDVRVSMDGEALETRVFVNPTLVSPTSAITTSVLTDIGVQKPQQVRAITLVRSIQWPKAYGDSSWRLAILSYSTASFFLL